MRLYLTSYQHGNRTDELVRLAGDRRHVAVVANAGDLAEDDYRAIAAARDFDPLGALGFTAEELDLRDYFGRPDALAAELPRFGVIWMRGGNAFVLRRALRQSGFDDLLRAGLERDDFVVAGYSAGPLMLTPTLRGIELMDDERAVPPGYDPEPIWDGLGLVPFSIVPHHRSDHHESADAERAVEHLIARHVPFIALRDGETIVVDGDVTKVV